MKQTIFALAALLLLGLGIQSCRKDSNYVSEQTTAEDIVSYNDLSEQTDFDIDELVPDNFTGDAEDRGDCPSVSFLQPQGTWPNTITLTYPTDGCDRNGHTFSGVIVVEQSNKMDVVGAVRNVSFQNFFIDNVKIEGTRSLTNLGPNASAQPTWHKIAAETFTFPSGVQATYNADHTRTMTEGFDTPQRPDNVWSITGTSDGVNRMGEAYTANITSALIKRFLCPWVVEGVIEFTLSNNTRTLNFGDGTCDRDATLTLADGTVKEVKIRHHWW